MDSELYFFEEAKYGDFAWREKPIARFAEIDQDDKREYWATLALTHCRNLGVRTRAKLLKCYGSAFAAFENCADWPKIGVSPNIVSEIRGENWRINAKKEWDAAKKLNPKILLWDNSLYPSRLREISDPPAMLYCNGDTELFKGPAIAIVGSRDASERSLEEARVFAQALSECGLTVVSGMALGIDSKAHQGALAGVGKSIGVLGAGIDIEYPFTNRDLYAQMKKSGLLVSEFAPHTPPGSYNFPVRNRIISGLSLGVIVVEAAGKSGSLITARLALEQNREVFAVPGPALSERSKGCQNLLRQGAHPLFSVDDVLGELADELKQYKISFSSGRDADVPLPDSLKGRQEKLDPPKAAARKNTVDDAKAAALAQKIDSTDNSSKIMRVLLANEAMQIDELAAELNMATADLSPVLICLEMLGKIKRLPGAIYVPNR